MTAAPRVGILPGASLHEELAFFEDAGIPPAEVLLTATSRAARFVDPNAAWGVVEEGHPADLLVVSGDPTVSVRALGQIRHVVKEGWLIERLP